MSEVKVSRNGPERRSGKRIIAGTAFRSEFQISEIRCRAKGWGESWWGFSFMALLMNYCYV